MLALSLSIALAGLPAAPKLGMGLTVPPPVAGTICYPSGMQVRLEQREGTGLASVTTVLDGGKALEDEATRSAAHLVEHLWFQSTPDGGPRVWDRSAGLALDATTRRDVTTYTAVGAVADLEGLLALEAARLADPLQGIDEATIEREKHVVRSELGLRGEHGQRLALQQLDAVLYPEGHPYRGVIATSAHVSALGMEQLRAYIERAYQPQRTTLSVVADLPLSEQQALVIAALGDHLDGDGQACGASPSAAAPPTPATGTTVVPGAVWQPQVYVGFTLPAGWRGHDAVATTAVGRLSDLVNQRMGFVRGLRGDQLALTGCSYLPGREASSATCLVVLPEGVSPEAVVDAIRGTLDEQWSKMDRDAYDRRVGVAYAITDAFHGVAAASDSWQPDALAELAVSAHRGQSTDILDTIGEITNVTDEAVVAFASEWLRPDRMVALVMIPEGAAGDAGRVVPQVSSLSAPALPSWAPPPSSATVAASTLDNGLTVWAAEHPRYAGVRGALVSEGGWARGPVAADAVYDLAVGYRTPIPFFDLAAGMGLRFWTQEDPWGIALGNQAASGNIDLSMWVHRMLMETAIIDHAVIQGSIDDALSWVVDELPQWPGMHVEHLQRRHLYGDHRLGTTAFDRLAAGRKLKSADMLGWRRRTARPDATTLVVASPDAAATAAMATTYLDGWKVKPSKTEDAVVAPPPPPARQVRAVVWSSRYATVDVTCRVPGPGADRAASLEVLSHVLEQATWASLRDGAGAYAPSVWVQPQGPDEALLSLVVDVTPDQASGALQALLDTLALAKEGVPEELRAWAVRDAQGSLSRVRASGSSHVDFLIDEAAGGADLASIEGRMEALGAVSSADLSALLEPCVGHEAAVVVGPPAALATLKGATPYDAAADGKAWADSLR